MSMTLDRPAYERKRSWHGHDTGWMRLGACADISDAEKRLFFADTIRGTAARGDEKAAKQFCRRCDVQLECLAYALRCEMQGIWGGMNEKERRVHIRRAKALRS